MKLETVYLRSETFGAYRVDLVCNTYVDRLEYCVLVNCVEFRDFRFLNLSKAVFAFENACTSFWIVTEGLDLEGE